MKKIEKAPSIRDLTWAYNQYQSNNISLNLFLETFEWCRYDPRLGEILIQTLKDFWPQWNPLEISQKLKGHSWPQVWGVLGSHVFLLLSPSDRSVFLSWLDCCFYQVSFNKEWSTFFIGVFKFGGKSLKNEAFDSIPLYLKWGYYGKTPMIPINPQSFKYTLIPKRQRLEKLKELFHIKKRIRLQDYREYLDFKISKRTAELDLKQWSKKSGQTKGASYIFKVKSKI